MKDRIPGACDGRQMGDYIEFGVNVDIPHQSYHLCGGANDPVAAEEKLLALDDAGMYINYKTHELDMGQKRVKDFIARCKKHVDKVGRRENNQGADSSA